MGRVIQIGEQNPAGVGALEFRTQPFNSKAFTFVDEFPTGQEADASIAHRVLLGFSMSQLL
jgi:hypothetical protein